MDEPAAIHQALKEPSPGVSFSPEFRLLLHCSLISYALRGSFRSAGLEGERAGICKGPVDWDVFAYLVNRHGVPTQASTMLKHCAPESIPPQIAALLQEKRIQSQMQAFRLTAELARIGRSFTAERIELLPLKGPLLSADLYGNPTFRHMQDLDLMVKPGDLDRADRLLLNEGYRRTLPNFDLTKKQKKTLQSTLQHFHYVHPEHLTKVELHWRISLWTPGQIEELWDHSHSMEWAGAHFRQLGKEMMLLFLCSHGSCHEWFRIKWLSDVATLLSRGPAMDWSQVIAMAGRLDLRRSLAQVALLVRWLYGLPLNNDLAALAVREKTAVTLARRSVRSMLMTERELNALSIPDKCKREWYSITLRSRPPYVQHLQRLFVDVETWKSCPLPDEALWLYYLLRLPMWFRRHYL